MIKRAVLLLIVIFAVSSLIQFSMASQETYEWYPCKIDVIASEDWQPDSAFEVRVRITLNSSVSYKVRIHSVGVLVSSEGFHYDDTKQDDTELGTLSPYWEKEFAFNFSTDKLSRGENFTVSIVAIIDMYKLIGSWEYEQLWYNSDDPMTTTLYMPIFLPNVSLLLPQGGKFNTSDAPLDFTVDQPVSQIKYSLDGKENVTITGNTTLTGLANGYHNITVYAMDEAGNTGASETLFFNVEVPEPFPVVPVAAASIAVVVAVGAGLLVYFKKRKSEAGHA